MKLVKIHSHLTPSPLWNIMFVFAFVFVYSVKPSQAVPFSSFFPPSEILTPPNSRSRSLVAGPDGIIAPKQTSVVPVVRSGETDQGARVSVASSGNFDLGAAQIDLSSSGALSLVQGDAFYPYEVFPVGDVLGDRKLDGFFVFFFFKKKKRFRN